MGQKIGSINRLISLLIYGSILYMATSQLLPKNGLPEPYSRFAGTKMGVKAFALLTIWNVTFNFIFFALSVLHQFFCKANTKCLFNDVFYHSIILPLSVTTLPLSTIIGLWSIYKNILKISWSQFILDQFMHSMISIPAVVEGYCFYHCSPRYYKTQILIGGLLAIYGSFSLYLGFAYNYWVYPIFLALNKHQKVLFVISFTIAGIIMSIIVEKWHQKIWKHQRRSLSTESQKEK